MLSDRLCRLVIYKDLVRIIEKNKEIEDNEKDDEENKSENKEDDLLIFDEEEHIEEIKPKKIKFQPNHWENYLWRSKKLETVTFPEMLTNYQWCSRLDLVPARWMKPDENGIIKPIVLINFD